MTIQQLVENKPELDYQQICSLLISTFNVEEKVNWDSVLPLQQQQEFFGGETLRLISEHPILNKQKDVRPIALKRGSVSQMLFFYVCLEDSSLPKKHIQDITKKFISGSSANRFIIWFFGNKDRSELKVVLSAKEGKKIVLKTLPFGINQPFYKTYTFILSEVNQKVNKLFVEPIELWQALWNAFDISIVNRNFYFEIKGAFEELLLQLGKKRNPFQSDEDRVQFAIRLIGRIIFCWFLKRKGVLAEGALSSNAVKSLSQKNYYHDLLESLFFDVLNTPEGQRSGGILKVIAHYPFLNGGLFDPQLTDYRKNHLLEIENDWFVTLFSQTLERYNFTVDENSTNNAEIAIDPEMLGRIFENLLAEQNPETGESARKSTGSFYTPREVVDYMVEESIYEYLKRRLSKIEESPLQENLFGVIPNQQLAIPKSTEVQLHLNLQNALHDFVHTQVFSKELREVEHEIKIALDNIKILDPACGSGAFPIGVLQKIVGLKQQLHPKSKNYTLKLNTIENSIYGVDIQPMAVELSRLRCWLSLVVDEDPKEIKSLPNLDFKFVCADSLIDIPDDKYIKMISYDTMQQFSTAVGQYFNPDYKSKDQLRAQIKSCLKKIINDHDIAISQVVIQIRKEQKSATATRLKKLNDTLLQLSNEQSVWHTYENVFKNKKVGFFTPKYFFPSAQKGFDIVIGNPPYGITYTDQEIKRFRNEYDVVVGHSEAYYLFIERGLKLLKPNSILSFITPNAWLSNKYAKEVRNVVLKKNTLLSLINLNQKLVFENAGVEASVFVIENAKSQGNEVFVGNDIEKEKLFSFDPKMWLESENLIIGFSADSSINEIFQAVKSSKTKLSDLLDLSNGFKPYQVGYGKNLKGQPLNEEDVANRIYHSDKKSNNNYKKQVKGKNIGKYSLSWTEGYINWGDWLMSPKEDRYFENPKILIRQIISDTLICTLDKERFYADQSAYIAINYPEKPISLEYCTAVLNSKLMGFYFRKYYSEDDALFPKIKVNELKDLPLKEASSEVQGIFSKLVESLLFIHRQELDSTINKKLIARNFEDVLDGMVMELYFEEEMKNKKIDLISLVSKEIAKNFKEITLENIISFHSYLSHPDSEIRNRILSFPIVSSELLKPILQG